MEKLNKLENKIGVKFNNEDLLVEALTHRSYLNEHPKWRLHHNERLEYLGDAVLELVVSDELFRKFPNAAEGRLTVLRSALVNSRMLHKVALDIGLHDFVVMSKGEQNDNSKAHEVILADAVEAVIGAIYIDKGLEKAKIFIDRFILKEIDHIIKSKAYKDAKSEFQEIIQEKFKITPVYKVLEEHGPAHKRTFKIGVFLDDKLIAFGEGFSKQEAEVKAAEEAIKQYK